MSVVLPPGALAIGLGCSRLGSVNGASWDEARVLLKRALDEGIRFFDTSNIYGQGDSERLLGEVLGRESDAVVASKAGKYVAWHRRALVPLKGVVRASVRRSSSAKQGVALARSKPMPTRWDSAYITRSLEGSLKRLKREQVHLFMLHSPPAEVIRTGDAVGALEQARQAGKVDVVGVSVDDVDTARACLADERVRALQVPLHPGDRSYDDVLESAHTSGVIIIGRELLGGIGVAVSRPDPGAFAKESILAAVRNPRISIPLVGATRVTSLLATVEAARLARSHDA
ncbi:aldo/keto reductase [Nocardioides sp. Kera G14]|uniref:aldo/keto reductase n=1 Tax=Nocardioides sp. Kera G14 TaxID=2884264 RepID=UPI001D1198AE|nr:aldo/keto reductase [Nocardioides sp. Kera G14]UDY23120.1 aldo/keto reductase [Nocardioides sp. Kera G14]